MTDDRWGPRELGFRRRKPPPYLRPVARIGPTALWVAITPKRVVYQGHPGFRLTLDQRRPGWYRRSHWRMTAVNSTTGAEYVRNLGPDLEEAKRSAVTWADNRWQQ